MVLIDRLKAKRQQVENAASLVREHCPTTGRQTNAQKYFQAWTVKEIVTPSGKIRAKRVYSGPSFCPQTKPGVRTMQKILSLLLSLACCVLLYLGSSFSGEASNRWYIYILQALCCLGCFFLVGFSSTQAITKNKLTLDELRGASTRLLPCALFVSVIFAVTALFMLIHAAFIGFSANAIASVVCMLVSFVCAAIIFYMEYRTEYVHVFNEYAPSDTNPESN